MVTPRTRKSPHLQRRATRRTKRVSDFGTSQTCASRSRFNVLRLRNTSRTLASELLHANFGLISSAKARTCSGVTPSCRRVVSDESPAACVESLPGCTFLPSPFVRRVPPKSSARLRPFLCTARACRRRRRTLRSPRLPSRRRLHHDFLQPCLVDWLKCSRSHVILLQNVREFRKLNRNKPTFPISILSFRTVIHRTGCPVVSSRNRTENGRSPEAWCRRKVNALVSASWYNPSRLCETKRYS
jgi:hypothetical protein